MKRSERAKGAHSLYVLYIDSQIFNILIMKLSKDNSMCSMHNHESIQYTVGKSFSPFFFLSLFLSENSSIVHTEQYYATYICCITTSLASYRPTSLLSFRWFMCKRGRVYSNSLHIPCVALHNHIPRCGLVWLSLYYVNSDTVVCYEYNYQSLQ